MSSPSDPIRSLLGDFDPKAPPARIEPVAEGVERPMWSVVIPTFNCAEMLRRTLESVLAQDPGPERMHIEVVDDCSTQDDPEAVVRELGGGRVRFTRNAANTGCCTINFNHCLRHSIGRWVHVLHGDDWVLPGFYRHMEELIERHPGVALVAARSVFVDEAGCWEHLGPPVRSLSEPGTDSSAFDFGTPLQFAGVVVRRCFYEEYGGFREDLVHTADWEMWERAVSTGGGIVSDEVFGAYRVFAGNDSGRLMRTGGNLLDRLRLIEVIAARRPAFPKARALKRLVRVGQDQEARFRRLGDAEAAEANRRIWRQLGGFPAQVDAALRRLKHRLVAAGR